MQQKQITDIRVELLAYIEPKPEERTWSIDECVPYPESWKKIEGGYQRKKLNPGTDEDWYRY